jgi:predicted MFS family arabinose efflux permease
MAGAIGGVVGGLLYDVTGGYRSIFAVAMVTVLAAVSPFWTRRPLPAQ